MRVGVIDDACMSSIHTMQTVGQCITCAVHSEWCTHYTILYGLVYIIAIQHTGTIKALLMLLIHGIISFLLLEYKFIVCIVTHRIIYIVFLFVIK